MDGERRANVMELELAMQREVAYRKKVDMWLWELHGDAGEGPLSLQLPSSSPSSGQSLSGTKRKTPTWSSPCLPPKQQQPLYGINTPGNTADDSFCMVCQVTCPSSFHLKQHLLGQRHKDMVNKVSGRNMVEEGSTRQWCEVCEIWCMNKYSLTQHFAGRRHQEKVEGLKLGGKEGEVKANQGEHYCELCKRWCIDGYSFNQHLNGKNHILNLRESEKKRMAKGKELLLAADRTRNGKN